MLRLIVEYISRKGGISPVRKMFVYFHSLIGGILLGFYMFLISNSMAKGISIVYWEEGSFFERPFRLYFDVLTVSLYQIVAFNNEVVFTFFIQEFFILLDNFLYMKFDCCEEVC